MKITYTKIHTVNWHIFTISYTLVKSIYSLYENRLSLLSCVNFSNMSWSFFSVNFNKIDTKKWRGSSLDSKQRALFTEVNLNPNIHTHIYYQSWDPLHFLFFPLPNFLNVLGCIQEIWTHLIYTFALIINPPYTFFSVFIRPTPLIANSQ
jgi:hypothetical protein